MSPLTPQQRRLYRQLRALLWIGILTGATLFGLSVLFPRITQSFDFSNPGALRNTIVSPRAPDGSPLTQGKVAAAGTLIANTSLLGDFSEATVGFTLTSHSLLPSTVTATIRRGYQATRLPLGPPITSTPQAEIFLVDGTYYQLNHQTLTPFISEAAYHSRFPNDQSVTRSDNSLFDRYPRAKEPIGFRIGSLLAFDVGVFVVTSETEIRPVISAETFLALGYHFQDVIPVSEEELGIYTRGRIIVLNTPHGDGTLFHDVDTNELWMVEQGTRRVITDQGYRDFLLTKQTPIETRLSDTVRSVTCKLQASFWPRQYHCSAELTPLNQNLGFDYELTLTSTESGFEMDSLDLAFNTHVTLENARTLGAKVKQRILARFGLAQ